MRTLLVLSLMLLSLPSAFAYIDPGTGGYLISVVWQYIVAFFAFVSASIIFFFKHKVRELWQKKWAKVLVLTIVLLLVIATVFFIFKPAPQGGLL